MSRPAGERPFLFVVGARPNFMKAAPVVAALRGRGARCVVVHTGQHFDEAMSRVFFAELGLSEPDENLGLSGGGRTGQLSRMVPALADSMRKFAPRRVVVVGDVNSTLAGALAAASLGTAVAHVEAGLRSFDFTMPEEVNRILTDAIADLLFVTEESGVKNLRASGVPEGRLHLVGNAMIDTLLAHREKARATGIVARLGLEPGAYALATLHRPANVDRKENLARAAGILAEVSRRLPLLLPVHPRTREKIAEFGLAAELARAPGLRLLEPLGYLEFLGLMQEAAVVLTDSGGIQEETTALGVPCLTMRENTERPATVERGTNTLVGLDRGKIIAGVERALSSAEKSPELPELWEGRAGERMARILLEREGAGR